MTEEKRPPRYEVKEREDGQWHLRVWGANNEIVLTTEGYTRKADAERAKSTVRRIALEEAAAYIRGEGGLGSDELADHLLEAAEQVR